MDILALPVRPLGRPASSSAKPTQQPLAVEAAAWVQGSGSAARAPGAFERVVQGELLDRQATPYQSTRAFLTERSMERAQPAGRQSESPHQSRPAIASYLHHSRPESVPDLTQGRSVDLLV